MSEATIDSVISGERRWVVAHGDCLKVLKTIPDASIDAVVTDPPYELGFMGKKWDASGIAYSVELWAEVLRVLKPGGHLLAFGGTRTYHRMACAIEDAGLEIRDSIHWIYGSGFPKSLDVSKAIDKAAGAEREVVGFDASRVRPNRLYKSGAIGNIGDSGNIIDRTDNGATITAPATEAACQWSGWGTALKPAHEPIVMARKPLAGTVAENVLQYGTGAINVEVCRIGNDGGGTHCSNRDIHGKCKGHRNAGRSTSGETFHGPNGTSGRWPANVLLSHDEKCGDGCVEGCPVAELDRQSGHHPSKAARYGARGGRGFGDFDHEKSAQAIGRWPADPGGGASRFFNTFEPDDVVPFFYSAKPSTRERDAGLDDLPVKKGHEVTNRQEGSPGSENPRAGITATRRNIHPTVKGQALMRHLVRLVTPPGGIVLDPFAGSGSTLVAAMTEGFRGIGIEREDEYIDIARRRVEHAATLPSVPKSSKKQKNQLKLKTEKTAEGDQKEASESAGQLGLWSDK